MDPHALLLFLGVDVLMVCTPGPDWLYIVARGLGQGRRTALTAVAGVCAGYAVHTLLSAAGLAAALRAVPALLPALRLAGAGYLAFLAAGMLLALRRGAPVRTVEATGPQPARTVLRQSLLTALLNPKGLLLYLSLVPQFVTPDGTLPVGGQVAALGAVNVLCCAAVYSAVALGAARLGGRLGATPTAARRLSAVSAVLLLAVAGVTAAA
ncbi:MULTISPECIES: LysE family translocator [Kitasatospora]|uniref:Putative efflux protein n=1 Tax=Kitasatospora setae (strain ATCC 33774 / DSM 43861 / JCM 3304 / KCC A-0304 / NBRC 14216 / KM-6054) TaxID=452652 RepID=E4N199_KITSK|nr:MULTISPECIES: LysE family translocator [Kitasatospora]BAJ31933.1 putative efflux protein [Kitasatospora setae KM-6054]